MCLNCTVAWCCRRWYLHLYHGFKYSKLNILTMAGNWISVLLSSGLWSYRYWEFVFYNQEFAKKITIIDTTTTTTTTNNNNNNNNNNNRIWRQQVFFYAFVPDCLESRYNIRLHMRTHPHRYLYFQILSHHVKFLQIASFFYLPPYILCIHCLCQMQWQKNVCMWRHESMRARVVEVHLIRDKFSPSQYNTHHPIWQINLRDLNDISGVDECSALLVGYVLQTGDCLSINMTSYSRRLGFLCQYCCLA